MKNKYSKIAIVMSVALSLAACSPNKSVEDYISSGKENVANYKTNEAIIELKNAVRLDAKNADARFYLASAYLQQGSYASAEKEFEKALELGSTQEFLISSLIEVKMKLDQAGEVVGLLEETVEKTVAEKVIAFSYAGLAAYQLQDKKLAKEWLQEAVELGENSPYGLLSQAYILFEQGKIEEALEKADNITEHNPKLAQAISLKGYLFQALGQSEQAAFSFKKYYELRPRDFKILFFIAQNFIDASKYDEAIPYVDLLLKISARQPLANQFKAQIEFNKENYKLAKEHADIAYQGDDKFIVARIIAGVSAYKLQDFEQAYQTLLVLKGSIPVDHIVNKILVDLQLRLGYDQEAVESLNILVNSGKADASLLTLASSTLLDSGDSEAAQELLQTSIDLNDQNPTEIAKQGIMQLKLQESSKGIKMLEEALKLDPSLTFAENGLAVGYLTNKEYDKALIIAKKWQAIPDKNIQGYLLESAIYHQQKQYPQAKTLLLKVMTLDENNIPALYKLAVYAHKDKEQSKAFDYYTRLLAKQPQHLLALKNFIRLISYYQDLIPKSINFYKELDKSDSSNNYIKLGLAYSYKVAKKYDEAINVFHEIQNSSNPLDGIEIAIGDTYKLAGDWQKAVINYQSMLDKNPKNLLVAQKLFALYEQTRQIDKALAQVNKILAYYDNNEGLLLLKSYYQSLLKQQTEEKILQQLASSETVSDHWLYDRTMGNFSYNEKDFNTASRHYLSAYKKQNSAENAIKWAKSEGLKGDIDSSINILLDHLKADSKSQSVKIMLAGAYLKQNLNIKATALYEEVYQVDKNNVLVLNNLSYLALVKGDSVNALKYAEQAVELTNNTPAILDTLGQALVASGRIEEGIMSYDKALELLQSPSNEILIHKAQALIKDNQMLEAKKILMAIGKPTIGEAKEIKTMLEGM